MTTLTGGAITTKGIENVRSRMLHRLTWLAAALSLGHHHDHVMRHNAVGRPPTDRRCRQSWPSQSPAWAWCCRGGTAHRPVPGRQPGCRRWAVQLGRRRRMTRQEQKAVAFPALHAAGPFVLPNPWDAGSVRVLEALCFQALAATSSGFAFTLGRRDSEATLDAVVEHTAALDRATMLPLSVDLENGYGTAKTIPDVTRLIIVTVGI
jgi:Phosphoenolpyruvate phosphomutase